MSKLVSSEPTNKGGEIMVANKLSKQNAQELIAIWRFLTSSGHFFKKIGFVLFGGAYAFGAWVYGVFPVDLVSDVVPIAGSVDDLSVWGVGAAIVRWFYKDYRDTYVRGDYMLDLQQIEQKAAEWTVYSLRQLYENKQRSNYR